MTAPIRDFCQITDWVVFRMPCMRQQNDGREEYELALLGKKKISSVSDLSVEDLSVFKLLCMQCSQVSQKLSQAQRG